MARERKEKSEFGAYRNQDAKATENHEESKTDSFTYHLLFILAIQVIIVYTFNKDDYY